MVKLAYIHLKWLSKKRDKCEWLRNLTFQTRGTTRCVCVRCSVVQCLARQLAVGALCKHELLLLCHPTWTSSVFTFIISGKLSFPSFILVISEHGTLVKWWLTEKTQSTCIKIPQGLDCYGTEASTLRFLLSRPSQLHFHSHSLIDCRFQAEVCWAVTPCSFL